VHIGGGNKLLMIRVGGGRRLSVRGGFQKEINMIEEAIRFSIIFLYMNDVGLGIQLRWGNNIFFVGYKFYGIVDRF